MKINYTKSQKRGRSLQSVTRGSVVSFCKQFHQDHNTEDLFLVIGDNGYLSRVTDIHYREKVVIANLTTGKMSVVGCERECHIVSGEYSVIG